MVAFSARWSWRGDSAATSAMSPTLWISSMFVRIAAVTGFGATRPAAPHPGKELNPCVVERPAEIEGRVGGVQLGHPGDAGVELVEQQVDAGVGHGVQREVLGQVGYSQKQCTSSPSDAGGGATV